LLRNRRGRTQDDVAHALDMKRSTLSGYENQVAQPGIEALLAFSEYFSIAVDTLIRVNLSELTESQLSQVERGFDVYLKGSKLRVLATTVDQENNENIELVNEKASAGYTSGFADPDFIKVLPTFQLPFLSRNKKYRTFQIAGDSMLPIPDKSWVTGEYVENWLSIRSNYPYIVLTLDDGIVFKVVENRIKHDGKLKLISLNPLFEPYEIDAAQVKEVWKFVHYISSEMPEPNMPREKLMDEVQSLKKQVLAIQTKLNL
jgi:transcriptional regulator with XRE-family HTH domain